MRDLLVIGGGINGVGVARDAAGRGLKVTLCEKDDLASHTSSASTKLVHGGLRYLETYEFRLVAESLREREVLLKAAPHIVWPLRFVLPHDKNLRPRWMLRLGLFLYDRIGGRRTLPGSHGVDLRKPPHRAILKDRLTRGFEYSDCWIEDSRMVALAAMDARELGAEILTRTECIGLERTADGWIAALRQMDGSERVVEALAIINAAGPWVDGIAGLALGRGTPARLRLVKGSHIIVPRLYQGDHAYIFQQEDERIVFAIPYEHDFTLIGTTDELFEGDPGTVAISAEERAYLREAVGGYFRTAVTEEDIVSTYAGVRPLYDDHAASNSTVTRDYVFELDADDGAAPILSIYGGKITTFRKLAEHALEKLSDHLPMREAWTGDAPLPGGDMADFEAFVKRAGERYSWLSPRLLRRLCRAYGTRIDRVIGTADGMDRLGEHFGGDLYEAELRYLAREEFAQSAEDVLWRRGKLGLHLPDAAAARIDAWFVAEADKST